MARTLSRNHPTPDEIEMFALERLGGERRSRMVRHLASCPWCLAGVRLERHFRSVMVAAARELAEERTAAHPPRRRWYTSRSSTAIRNLRTGFSPDLEEAPRRGQPYSAAANLPAALGGISPSFAVSIRTSMPASELSRFQLDISVATEVREVIALPVAGGR